MKRKRMLAAVMAAVMASTLTMSMPVTGYAMDQGTETVASEPEESDSSDAAVTSPEQDADSVTESTTESDVVSESQGKDPDVASVAESKEAKSGAMAAPDTQSNTVGAAEENGAASAGTVGEAEDNEAASAETVGAAETNASTYNNHYYKIYSNKAATFDSAEKYCETLGGHLATITSEEENEAVYQGIKKSGYSNAFFGLYKDDKDDTWHWVNNEPVNFTYWASGEPSNQGGVEKWGMYYQHYPDGHWNDGDFNGDYSAGACNFICEWDSKEAYEKATTTPVPTQEAADIDTTKYDTDYTQLFQDFMINKDTWDAVKMLVKNENFPHFKYIYTHDQKTSTYIKAYFADAFYRDDLEGVRDMSSGEVSQEYARNVLLALMDQQEVETEEIVRAREVQKWGKFGSDLIKNTIDTSKVNLSDQVLKQLKQFCDSNTIEDALLKGKYKDLSEMYKDAGYKADPDALKLLKEAQNSPLNNKWLKGILKVADVGVDVGLDLADDYTVCQRIFDYDVSSETDQVYIELLTYIKDNAKFEVVRDAAADLLTTLTDERKSQQQKIASVFANGTGKKVVGMALLEVLDKIADSTLTGKKIKTYYKLVKWASDQVFQVKNYQEQYDNMRVLSYIGDAIGQWTLENYTAYIHNVHSSDVAQKNTYAKKSYFCLHWLISTREDGEKAYQGLKKRLLKKFSQDKEGYQSSLTMSTTMEKYRKTLFTDEREKAFYAEAVACPVDVEVYNSAGKKVLTIKNGQEIPVTTSGDIVYMEYQNPGNGEYGKIVILPKNAGYTLKYVGTGLGSMSLQTMNMSAETVSEKYLQNIPVAKGTVAEVSDPFGNGSSITLTTGKDSQKTTMKMKTPELTYVPVTSLTFSSASIKLKEGESSLVTVKVEPENAANQNITWTSASDSIATVSADGVVTGKSAGTTTLTASAEDGKVTKKLTVTVTKKENSGKSQESRSMYRLYNPNSGEHFYTSNQGERDHLVSLGWRYEGVAWNAPLTGAPIFRLYNPNAGDHHYTGSEKERDDLVKLGWKYECVAWYTAPSTTKKPQYRLYNPNCTGAGAHHYTGSTKERDDLVKLGWRYEGIAWYGV